MTGFHQDDVGDWVAELECGHNQHVRHKPPFQVREWVVDEESRRSRIGARLECPLCDRGELPEAVTPVRNSAVWDEGSMPDGLRREHRLGPGTWGVLHVESGALRFSDMELAAGQIQVIPPGTVHEVEPLGHVRFWIEFLTVDRASAAGTGNSRPARSVAPRIYNGVVLDADEGGDPACWAGLLCPECGAVMDGGPHQKGCPRGDWPEE